MTNQVTNQAGTPPYTDLIARCAAAMRDKHSGAFPKTALVLGSGLGPFGEEIELETIIPYGEIPGFPQSTVAGHEGRFLIGKAAGHPVICMQGRVHLYEGYPASLLAVPIRVLKTLGIERLILTNAAGSIRPDMPPGSLMMITDHINLSGQNPLIGPNADDFGPRFHDVSEAWTPALQEALLDASAASGVALHRGVYLQVTGPNFETPAEIRAFGRLGADAVGMSTVPEVLVASHSGMQVAGISLITNMAAGLSPVELTHTETIEEAEKAYEKIKALLQAFFERL
ncbi:MAG: purine-nucleoside phosphorylase [Pseudomonadota bacterium]